MFIGTRLTIGDFAQERAQVPLRGRGGVDDQGHPQTEEPIRDGQVEDEHVGHVVHALAGQDADDHHRVQHQTQTSDGAVGEEDATRVCLDVARVPSTQTQFRSDAPVFNA